MKHLTSLQLCAYLDDVLVGAPDDQTARHLAACAICRTRFESWCHVDDSLRELLGQDPDEHAMEQRMAWVEIAVASERKGLPAPEFAELRIPLPHAAPIPSVAPTPVAPAAPAPPREPLKRPVLQVPLSPVPGPASAAPPRSGPAPTLFAAAPRPAAPAVETQRLPGREPVTAAAPHAGAGSATGQAARAPGYARMPRAPRKGFAAFVSRPAVWLTLALVAVLATALPLGVAKFGIPEITFGFHAPHERDSSVRKAAAEAGTDGEGDARPARPRKGGAHASTAPDAGPPDASVLFDLPALEPEDGAPDSDTSDPAPRHSAPASDRDSDDRRDGPMICGEVRNTQGVPIEGARVTLTSPSRVVRTDRRGRFCIACPPGPRTIRIEATGRAPVTRTVQLGRNRLETRFTLDVSN